MDLSVIAAGTVTVASKNGLGFSKFIIPGKSAPSRGFLQISAVVLPVNAVIPPPVKSKYRTLPDTLRRKKRRTRRRSLTAGDDGDDGGEDGYFDGGDFDGPFGGGGGDWSSGGGGGDGGGGGGKGWNNDGFEGKNGDDFSWSRLAFRFVYEVIGWIVLSSCAHFAYKKIVRMVTDANRKKDSPVKVTSVC